MSKEINLDELLDKSFKRTKKIVNTLKGEIDEEDKDDIHKIKRDIEKDKINTENQKNKFISEIKNGLRDKIKENPCGVEKSKRGFMFRFFKFFNKLFK